MSRGFPHAPGPSLWCFTDTRGLRFQKSGFWEPIIDILLSVQPPAQLSGSALLFLEMALGVLCFWEVEKSNGCTGASGMLLASHCPSAGGRTASGTFHPVQTCAVKHWP